MVLAARPHRLSRSPEETRELGRALGRLLEPGDFVALIGELGAGKTALAGGLGLGLGVTEALRSPSYLLCCEHEGRHRVLHLDAYFEARMDALLAEGLPDRFRDAVLIVEWADRCAGSWPADRLEVRMSPGPGLEERQIALQATGPRSAQLLQAWTAGWSAGNSPATFEPGSPEQR